MNETQKKSRTLDSFYTDNFIIIEKQDNKSGRYWVKCKHCKDPKPLNHRDNRLLEHITNSDECPDAPAHVQMHGLRMLDKKRGGDGKSEDKGEGSSKRRKGNMDKIDSFLECPISKEKADEYDRKLLRFIIHANASFNIVKDPYFINFLSAVRPLYEAPSRYVLSGAVLSSESARIQLLEMERLQKRRSLTLLVDGWEDIAKRSLYGTVVAGVGQHPVVLGLADLTGKRATAEMVVQVCKEALKKMSIDPSQLGALCTDNPTVMKKVRKIWETHFSWIITFPCFLHQLNTLIGKIVAFSSMKNVARKNTRLVSFFNNSHYWGGQLAAIASELGIKRRLEINTESRWYALVLITLSVQQYKKALQTLCERPDAQQSKDGLSALPNDIIQLVTRDLTYWDLTNQFLRFCKPLIDAIRNLESRDATLADCMIELLRCAKHLKEVETYATDDLEFTQHAKETFTHQFVGMNTNLHWLALFLHPLCRKLAISQAVKSRSFSNAVDIALDLAVKWKWPKESAIKLMSNLRDYNLVKPPFTGGTKDAQDWWESLPVKGIDYLLKDLAINLFGLVPHSAEVEQLFSSLGGIQGVRRSWLNVGTFEKLGKIRCHLNSLLHEKAAAEGRTLRRTQASMHTRPGGGIDEEMITELEKDPSVRPALSSVMHGDNADLADRDELSMGELERAFEELEQPGTNNDLSSSEDLMGLQIVQIFDFHKLERALGGAAPEGFEEDHQVHHNFDVESIGWDKETLKRMGGVT